MDENEQKSSTYIDVKLYKLPPGANMHCINRVKIKVVIDPDDHIIYYAHSPGGHFAYCHFSPGGPQTFVGLILAQN